MDLARLAAAGWGSGGRGLRPLRWLSLRMLSVERWAPSVTMLRRPSTRPASPLSLGLPACGLPARLPMLPPREGEGELVQELAEEELPSEPRPLGDPSRPRPRWADRASSASRSGPVLSSSCRQSATDCPWTSAPTAAPAAVAVTGARAPAAAEAAVKAATAAAEWVRSGGLCRGASGPLSSGWGRSRDAWRPSIASGRRAAAALTRSVLDMRGPAHAHANEPWKLQMLASAAGTGAPCSNREVSTRLGQQLRSRPAKAC